MKVEYTDELVPEGLGFTVVLRDQLERVVLEELKKLVENWYGVGFFGGFGGNGFHSMTEVEYEEDDLWVAWTVDMGDVGEEAINVLAKVLDGFNREYSVIEKLIVGHIIEE